jgi:hypothetical protein
MEGLENFVGEDLLDEETSVEETVDEFGEVEAIDEDDDDMIEDTFDDVDDF